MIDFFAGMWTASWVNQMTLVFGAAVFLSAIISFIYAVTLYEGRRDAGFMFTPNGEHEVAWETSMPLNVFFDPNVPDAVCTVFARVIDEINDIVGRRLFTPHGLSYLLSTTKPLTNIINVPRDTLYITTDRTFFNNIPTYGKTIWRHGTQGELQAVIVAVRADMFSTVRLWNVVRHEMGHAVGLTHDEDPDSVMTAHFMDDRARDYTHDDKKRLQEKYA